MHDKLTMHVNELSKVDFKTRQNEMLVGQPSTRRIGTTSLATTVVSQCHYKRNSARERDSILGLTTGPASDWKMLFSNSPSPAPVACPRCLRTIEDRQGGWAWTGDRIGPWGAGHTRSTMVYSCHTCNNAHCGPPADTPITCTATGIQAPFAQVMVTFLSAQTRQLEPPIMQGGLHALNPSA